MGLLYAATAGMPTYSGVNSKGKNLGVTERSGVTIDATVIGKGLHGVDRGARRQNTPNTGQIESQKLPGSSRFE
jgi:hypothetical protein